jgi:hypothetical protein
MPSPPRPIAPARLRADKMPRAAISPDEPRIRDRGDLAERTGRNDATFPERTQQRGQTVHIPRTNPARPRGFPRTNPASPQITRISGSISSEESLRNLLRDRRGHVAVPERTGHGRGRLPERTQHRGCGGFPERTGCRSGSPGLPGRRIPATRPGPLPPSNARIAAPNEPEAGAGSPSPNEPGDGPDYPAWPDDVFPRSDRGPAATGMPSPNEPEAGAAATFPERTRDRSRIRSPRTNRSPGRPDLPERTQDRAASIPSPERTDAPISPNEPNRAASLSPNEPSTDTAINGYFLLK